MKKCFFIVVLLMLQVGLAAAGGVVISNGVSAVTSKQIKKLYRGKINNIGGVQIKLADFEPLQKEFLKENVGKSVRGYKKIWAKKLFVEGVIGAAMFKTPEDIIKYLKETPNSIGYLPAVPKDAGDLKVLQNF